jgi:hypothetical protein
LTVADALEDREREPYTVRGQIHRHGAGVASACVGEVPAA